MNETMSNTAAVKKPKMNPKNRRRIIGAAIGVAVAAVGVIGLVKFLSGGEGDVEIMTQPVMMSSITSTVEGNGVAKAKESVAINITTAGTVVDVFVTEGQRVEMGAPLFTIESPAAQTAVEKARQDVSVKEKALEQLQMAADSLALQAEFSGKLLEVADLKVGDPVSVGQKLAKLVDDNTMVLEQYYSYAYEHDIRVGQTAAVSIPVVMEQLSGRVVEVNKVNRISAEGSRLFRVVIAVDNPGILTEGMMASACILSGGESLYPYEQSVLEYNETMEVTSKVSGTVAGIHMLDYLDVGAGQLLLEISGDESELALYSAEEALAAAREALTKAEENLANLNAVAPISGTVMGLVISPGQEIAANTAVISIADTSTILVAAQVDERNISFIEQGMSVTVNQWGSEYFGYVESVSLTPEYSGSAAMYPATIVVENAEGRMVTGGSVTYSLVASESEGCLVLPIQCVKYVPNEETGESMSVVFVQTDVRPETAIDIADTSSIGVPEKGYFAVPVETGISDKYNVEILSGLNEGEVVFMNVMRQNSWN